MKRRTFGIGMLAGLAASLGSRPVLSQAWPTRPIRWVVPYPPGGPADQISRLIGHALSERVGQPVVVENRPGAGGNIGTEYVAKAPPDGYTLVLGTPGPMTVNRALYTSLPFDPEKDFAPITILIAYPNVLLANPASGPRSLRELLEMARTQDKPITYGSAGSGTSQHLTGELFARTAGIRMVHVPYKGSGPALNDVVGGHVPVIVDPLSGPSLALIRAGKVRALAVTSAQRSSLLPDVPTVSESGVPGFDAVGWVGVLAPGATPPAVLTRLADEFTAILRSPEIRAKIDATGAFVPTIGPDHFREFIRTESARWQDIVRSLNLKAD